MRDRAAGPLSMAVFALVCGTLLTFYLKPAPVVQTLYGADQLILVALANEIVSGQASFADWVTTPAPSYFPDLLLGLALAAALDDFRLQLAVYAMVMFLLVAGGSYALLRQLSVLRGGHLLLAASSPAAVLIVAMVLLGARDSSLIFLVKPVHHASIVPAALFSLCIVLSAAKSGPRPLHWIGLGTLSLLVGASDALFVTNVSFPLAIAGAVAVLFGLGGNWKLNAMNFAALGLSMAGAQLGQTFNPMQDHKRVYTTWFHELRDFFVHEGQENASPLESFGDRFSGLIEALDALIARSPFMSLGAMLLLLGLLAAWRWQKDKATHVLLIAFACMAASILAANFLVSSQDRYIINLLFVVSVASASVLLARLLESKSGRLAAVAYVPAGVVCLLAAVELAFWRPGPATPLDADCADRVLVSETARHGYAPNWFVRTLPMFSDEVETVVPHLWLTFFWTVQNLKDSHHPRDFALVGNPLAEPVELYTGHQDMVAEFGLPSKMTACNRAIYLVYAPPQQ